MEKLKTYILWNLKHSLVTNEEKSVGNDTEKWEILWNLDSPHPVSLIWNIFRIPSLIFQCLLDLPSPEQISMHTFTFTQYCRSLSTTRRGGRGGEVAKYGGLDIGYIDYSARAWVEITRGGLRAKHLKTERLIKICQIIRNVRLICFQFVIIESITY